VPTNKARASQVKSLTMHRKRKRCSEATPLRCQAFG
jgi:hypothetical protein